MPSRLAFGYDEVHQLPELLIGQYQFGIAGGASHRVDAEHAPVAYSETPQQVAYSRQMVDGALVGAGHYIPRQAFLGGAETDSPARTFKG